MVTDGWLSRMLAVLKKSPRSGPCGSHVTLCVRTTVDRRGSIQNHGTNGSIRNKSLKIIAGRLPIVPSRRSLPHGSPCGHRSNRRSDERLGSGNFETLIFGFATRLPAQKPHCEGRIHSPCRRSDLQALNIDYKRSLKRNWDIFRSKWNIPEAVPYGSGYTIYWIPATLPGITSLYPQEPDPPPPRPIRMRAETILRLTSRQLQNR